MPPRPGLLSRLRARLVGGRAHATVGGAFRPELEADWKELVEQVDHEMKKVGSSVVGSWEVGAAELGRVLVGRSDDKVLIERFSDALVPTLQPFQDLHKGVARAMGEGEKAGRASGALSDATAPLLGLVRGLGEKAVDGWGRTAKHLEPLYALTADPVAARARFEAGAPELRRVCDEAEAVLRARLEALPEAKSLWEGLVGAAEAWQLALCRGLEIAIDARAKGLVREIGGKG